MQLPIELHLTARAHFKSLGEKNGVAVGGMICMHLNWGMNGGGAGAHGENGQIMHFYVCR